MQLLLAVMAVVGVFLLVPRGVSVGTIEVHSTKMTFNATTLTYRIILEADVPIFNPNYLKVGAAVLWQRCSGVYCGVFSSASASYGCMVAVSLPHITVICPS
jgi:hypothetical protein